MSQPRSKAPKIPNQNKPNPVGGSNPTTKLTLEASSTHFSGPLPLPEHLKQYNDIVPNAAERIIAAAESETAHRHASVAKQFELANRSINTTRLGQVFAFLFGLGVLGIAVTMAVLGQSTEGVATVIGALSTLLATFIYSQKTSRRQRNQED